MNQAILSLLPSKLFTLLRKENKVISHYHSASNLSEAQVNKTYCIKDVISSDKEMVNFLFTLGCFKGESVTVISILSETYVIAIKDARYSIDSNLAKAVILL